MKVCQHGVANFDDCLKDATLKGKILEVIKKWEDQVPHTSYSGTYEEDRLELVDMIFNFLQNEWR